MNYRADFEAIAVRPSGHKPDGREVFPTFAAARACLVEHYEQWLQFSKDDAPDELETARRCYNKALAIREVLE